MLIVSIATAMSVASLNLYHRGKSSRQRVPKLFRRFLRSNPSSSRILDSYLSSNRPTSDSSNFAPLILRSYRSKRKKRTFLQDQWQASLDYLYRLIAEHQSRSDEQLEQNLIAEEWHMLGRLVDHLLVYLFLFGAVIVFGLIFGQVPHLRLK